jgi:uncharacterized protein (DUF1778 family)
MAPKTEQLQIRLTRAQKARLRRLARQAGQDVSTFVLSRALPDAGARVEAAVRALRSPDARSFALAELADALDASPLALDPDALRDAVAHLDVAALPPVTRNYVAAMVERVCAERAIEPPRWVGRVDPLDVPWFATDLASLRPYLLRVSPAPFKRRNLFVEAAARRI